MRRLRAKDEYSFSRLCNIIEAALEYFISIMMTGAYLARKLELENMMMLPWRAVHDYKFRYAPAPKVGGVTVEKDPYVNLLVDGQVIRRYVICGPSNGAQICILDGLTPGQQVVVD